MSRRFEAVAVPAEDHAETIKITKAINHRPDQERFGTFESSHDWQAIEACQST